MTCGGGTGCQPVGGTGMAGNDATGRRFARVAEALALLFRRGSGPTVNGRLPVSTGCAGGAVCQASVCWPDSAGPRGVFCTSSVGGRRMLRRWVSHASSSSSTFR